MHMYMGLATAGGFVGIVRELEHSTRDVKLDFMTQKCDIFIRIEMNHKLVLVLARNTSS